MELGNLIFFSRFIYEEFISNMNHTEITKKQLIQHNYFKFHNTNI